MSASPIVVLAKSTSEEREIALADHLAELLADDKYNTFAFLLPILPKYWEQKDEHSLVALPPRSIFKTLYYVHSTAGMREFTDKTRDFLADISGFLEGCLFHLLHSDAGPYGDTNLPFGRLVEALQNEGALPEGLADLLWAFNRAVNIPSKHFNSFPIPKRLDNHTFSVGDAAHAFVLMRKLAIALFELLRKKGVITAEWPPFEEKWLIWSPLNAETKQRRESKRIP